MTDGTSIPDRSKPIKPSDPKVTAEFVGSQKKVLKINKFGNTPLCMNLIKDITVIKAFAPPGGFTEQGD